MLRRNKNHTILASTWFSQFLEKENPLIMLQIYFCKEEMCYLRKCLSSIDHISHEASQIAKKDYNLQPERNVLNGSMVILQLDDMISSRSAWNAIPVTRIWIQSVPIGQNQMWIFIHSFFESCKRPNCIKTCKCFTTMNAEYHNFNE